MTSTHTWTRHCTASRVAGALTGSHSSIASQNAETTIPGLEICISNELETIVRPLHPWTEGWCEEMEEKEEEERRRKGPAGQRRGRGRGWERGRERGREQARERVVTRILRQSKAIRLHAPHSWPLTSIRTHSRSRPVHSMSTYYYVLVTLSPFGDSEYRQGSRERKKERDRKKKREGGRERERDRERERERERENKSIPWCTLMASLASGYTSKGTK